MSALRERREPPRRQFLQLAAGSAALSATARFARAQTYSARPVRIVVGFTAGGAFDITARLIGQWLSEQLHQPFIVENKPGASTNVAAEAAIRAPADGYTLFLAGATNAINATLYENRLMAHGAPWDHVLVHIPLRRRQPNGHGNCKRRHARR